MNIETLQDRIANAELKIEKKLNTIEKKTARIETIKKKIVDMGCDPSADRYAYYGTDKHHDFYWLKCDISSLEEDIKRGKIEIEETKKTLSKYNAQLAGEIEKESIFLKEIPESMKRMQTELVEVWDEFDKKRRAAIRNDLGNLTYKEFCKKWSYRDHDFAYFTDEQIHNNNVRDAKALILDLYNRVKSITGEVTDWSGIHATRGAQGFTVLNGIVIGKEGRASVESILAGGYNIQRLHVRVLVHDLN